MKKTLLALAVVLMFGSLSFAKPEKSDPEAINFIDHSIQKDLRHLLLSAAIAGTMPLIWQNNLVTMDLDCGPDSRGCCRDGQVVGYFQCSKGQRCLWGAAEGYYFEDAASCDKELN